MMSSLLLLGLLTVECRASPAALPLSASRLQNLLQTFVTGAQGRSFRVLGDENDFDHGHVLLDAGTGAPIAILYHTQELAADSAAGYLDAAGRNWIQWLDGRGIENARRYERSEYPRTAAWDWFVAQELPRLRGRHTITDKMLDPALLGSEISGSVQWTFTRVACGAAAPERIDVVLPDRTTVCLSLGSS
jgi:hypothetical protein